jgi:peptidoglycan-associated lipoprotein
MQIKIIKQLALIAAGAVLLASCAKTPGRATGGAGDGLSAQGLGELSGLGGQEAGEMYTTQAPHNQIYLFSYDSSEVIQKYIPSIDAQAAYLKTHPGASILLAGHTDERGSREYNVALGEHRANAVADLITMAGVNRQQIRVVSYGKERPANFGHDEAAHAQNRRVVLTFESTQ